MKKRIMEWLVFYFSLIIAWPFYWFSVGCEKLHLKRMINKIAEIIVAQFGEEVIVWRKEYDPIEKEVVEKAILALPSFGCTHYFERGGCAMCGFNREIEKYYLRWLHPWALILLSKLFVLNLAQESTRRQTQPFGLCIFMAGSFFHPQELPLQAQKIVFDYFLASSFKKLFLESRAEYIVAYQDYIKDLARKIKSENKILEVAIGLESSDNRIRNIYINKCLSRKIYQEAIQILKKVGVIVNSYVLIGAPYLDEKEIVEKAVVSAEFAWQSGSDIVSLEVYCVQAGTRWAELYKSGELSLPSLWAVLEIIRQIGKISPYWSLGEFSDWPQPIAMPTSCSRCQSYLLSVLTDLRQHHNLKILTNLYHCECNRIFKF